MKYKEIFDKMYSEAKEVDGCPPPNKLAFLGNHIFNFTTYDGDIDKLFAGKMLEVIDCILNRTTFKYQEDENNYINYLTMVNMPFLCNKLEWGMSIKGAWFDEYGYPIEKDDNTYNIDIDFDIPKKDINTFMSDLLIWSKTK